MEGVKVIVMDVVVVVVVGGGGVKLMSVNSDFSKISFDSKWFVVILCLVLISGVFQVILSDRNHGVDACFMLLYDII